MEKSHFNYDREKNTIYFNGTVIVDMSRVPEKAKAVVYSAVTVDLRGFDIEFQINRSSFPFDLKFAALSPVGLIKAIMENRLEVEGMVVSTEIQEAYKKIGSNDLPN